MIQRKLKTNKQKNRKDHFTFLFYSLVLGRGSSDSQDSALVVILVVVVTFVNWVPLPFLPLGYGCIYFLRRHITQLSFTQLLNPTPNSNTRSIRRM